MLSNALNGNEDQASLILSKITAYRYRNEVVQKIVDTETNKQHRLFTNSLFNLIGELDSFRNHLVHWHMMQRISFNPRTGADADTLFLLVPYGPITENSPKIFRNQIEEFTDKTCFAAFEANVFATFISPDHNKFRALTPSWREKFSRPLNYPPAPDHPLHPRNIGRKDPPPPSWA